MVGAIKEPSRQTIVCDICKTYVATAKKNAPQDILEKAFNLAINTHLAIFHSKDKESVTFSYGLRLDRE